MIAYYFVHLENEPVEIFFYVCESPRYYQAELKLTGRNSTRRKETIVIPNRQTNESQTDFLAEGRKPASEPKRTKNEGGA